MSLNLKFGAFKSYYDEGMSAYTKGDFSVSREYMLKAAEMCSDLATQYPTADMRAEFKKKGEDILKFIRTNLVVRPKEEVVSGGNAPSQKADNLESAFEPMPKDQFKVKLTDIAGLEEVKETIKKRLILPLKKPEVYKEYGVTAGGAILMYGPPGTGKTMIAKAVASESDVNFFYVPSDKLVDKYVGETEKKIAALFDKVRKNLPAVLFFDEFDTIASERSADDKVAKMTVAALLTQIDGLGNDTRDMLLLAATNTPWLIDGAVLSRCKNLYLPLPDAEARATIFHIHLKKNLKKKDIDYVLLADQTEGLSGRDISKICEEIRLNLASRCIETGDAQICTMDDLLEEIRAAKKRPRPNLRMFETYNKEHSKDML
ncbi:MAG: ATP-binding protein [Firmicutes bacterium]|nr:ATP-binding protein [Bacillota bacterium]